MPGPAKLGVGPAWVVAGAGKDKRNRKPGAPAQAGGHKAQSCPPSLRTNSTTGKLKPEEAHQTALDPSQHTALHGRVPPRRHAIQRKG